MRIEYPVAWFIVVVILVAAAHAQSAFLKPGQSGYAALTDLVVGSEISGEGITVGYSSKGYVDATVSVAHVSFLSPYPFSYYNNDQTISGTSFFLELYVHLLRQDSAYVPASIALSSGCEFGSYYSPPNLRATTLLAADFHFLYGAAAYRNLDISPTTYIQPSIGIEYSEGYGLVRSYSYGRQASNDYSLIGFVGVAVAFRTSENTTIIIRPEVGASRRKPAFHVDVGVVLAAPK